MALVTCADCGHNVSPSAKRCPRCGRNIHRARYLRAVIWLILLIAIVATIKGLFGIK